MDESNFTQLVFKDSDGSLEDCGIIATKRTVGDFSAWMTYQHMDGEPEGVWWIIIRCERRRKVLKLGYREESRQRCWAMFSKMTVEDIEYELARPDTASA